MCEYCRCIGNYHDPMCPNYEEPKGVLHLTCAVCDCLLWEDEPTEWLAFTDNDNTDYVCNDCLRDYLMDKHICD